MFGRIKAKKVAKGSEIPNTIEAAESGSKGYPERFRISALRERRLLMAIRGISFALIIAIILNVVQAFLLVSLMPLKEIRPFLVQVAEEGTLVAAIQPIQNTFDAKDVLTEKLIREYVVNRHEILRSNAMMRERWNPTGYIGMTTDPKEYRRFSEQVMPVLEEIRQREAKRRATIQSVSAVSVGEIYVVDFRSTSYDQNDRVVDERTYTATIEIEFRPLKDLTREQMIINPTGFTVINYSLAEKDQ